MDFFLTKSLYNFKPSKSHLGKPAGVGEGVMDCQSLIYIWFFEKILFPDQVEKKIYCLIQFWKILQWKHFNRRVLMAKKYSDFLNVNKVLTLKKKDFLR